MLNLTLAALTLSSVVQQSSILSPSHSSRIEILRSKIDRISSPFLLSRSLWSSSVRFERFLASNTLTSLVDCRVFDENTYIYSGNCITATSSTFALTFTQSYEITGANFTFTNCVFANCTGSLPLFNFVNSKIEFFNSTVSNSGITFINSDTSRVGTMFRNSHFIDAYQIITANQGDISFDNCNFERVYNLGSQVNYIQLNSCSLANFTGNTFTNISESFLTGQVNVIYTSSCVDVRIHKSNFITTSRISLNDNTYAMVIESCFFNAENNLSVADAGSTVLFVDNHYSEECPYIEPVSTLSSERRAYAITTIVVFSVAFAALFITLIALVFCKVKEETIQYGKLHEDGIPEESADSRDQSD